MDRRTNTYKTGFWAIPEADAQILVEQRGWLFLHETKNQPSTFGGRVIGYELVNVDRAHDKRIDFTIVADPGGKGVAWQGRSGHMAHYSGIVE